MKPNVWISSAAAITGLIAGVGATWIATAGLSSFTSESWRRAQVLSTPRPVSDLTLEDHTGQVTRMSSLCNRTLVVDFIYTRCSTICQALGGVSSQLARRLSVTAPEAQVISISFDTTHDTPQALSAFKRAMEPMPTAWRLMRVSEPDDTVALLNTFGVTVIPDGYGGWDHNAALHVVSGCRLIEILDATDIDGAERRVQALRAAAPV